MRRYRGNVVVQEQAAKMLRSLAEMSERNKAGVREQGGVGDLVEAMRLHQDHAGLQREACGALGSMARLSEKNKEAIARASAIPLVIGAMRSHPAALEQACWAIRNLAGACEGRILAGSVWHPSRRCLRAMCLPAATRCRVAGEG